MTDSDRKLVERAERGDRLSGSEYALLDRVAPDVYARFIQREREKDDKEAHYRHMHRARITANPQIKADREREARLPITLLRWLSRAVRGRRRAASAILVYLAVRAHRNAAGEAWPSQEKIAEMLGMTAKTVSQALQPLAQVGLVTVTRRGQTSSKYYLPDSPTSVESDIRGDSTGWRPDSPTSPRPDSPTSVAQTNKRTTNLQQGKNDYEDAEVKGLLS